MNYQRIRFSIYGLFSALIVIAGAGCVTDIKHTSIHAEMSRLAQPGQRIVIDREISIDLPKGYSTDDLRAHRTWRHIGDIPQGQLFKPVDTVMLVKAGDKYEGYLVLFQHRIAGIYLPAVSAFVALDTLVDLSNASHPVGQGE